MYPLLIEDVWPSTQPAIRVNNLAELKVAVDLFKEAGVTNWCIMELIRTEPKDVWDCACAKHRVFNSR